MARLLRVYREVADTPTRRITWMIACKIIRRECITTNMALGKAMVLNTWAIMVTAANMRRQ